MRTKPRDSEKDWEPLSKRKERRKTMPSNPLLARREHPLFAMVSLALAKCINPIGPCSGKMVVRIHEGGCQIWRNELCTCWVSERVWVAAHHSPVFVQCDECGYAPCGRFGKPKPRRKK